MRNLVIYPVTIPEIERVLGELIKERQATGLFGDARLTVLCHLQSYVSENKDAVSNWLDEKTENRKSGNV